MANYKIVPVASAQAISEEFQKGIVVIAAWDAEHSRLHTTTYGDTPVHKEWAASAGQICAQALGADIAIARTYEDYRIAAIRRLTIALEAMADQYGGKHDEDCPCDDTCDCSGKPLNDQLNAAINLGRQLLGITDSAPTATHFPEVHA